MNDNTFRKKLNELGVSTKRKIEYFFEGATNNAHEFVEKFKTMGNKKRLQAVKTVGTGLVILLALCGLTGCMDSLGNILNAQGENEPKQTTVAYNNPDETTRTPIEITTPYITTPVTPPNVTTPGGTTITPPEVSTPGETTTAKPVETTKPGGSVVTPSEDLPADEDGYAYPAFFASLVKDTIVNEGLFNSASYIKYLDVLKTQTPEIVFVERAESTDEEKSPIAIYAKYTLNGEDLYVRMAYTISGNEHIRLGKASRYSSYQEYVAAVQKALQAKAELANADISLLYENQNTINNQIGEGFAKALGDNFVDASVNSVRMPNGGSGLEGEISGFAYDKEGKSYSYVLRYEMKRVINSLNVILGLENGSIKPGNDFSVFEVTSTPVAGVFQEQENEA